MQETVAPQTFWATMAVVYGTVAVILLAFYLSLRRQLSHNRRHAEAMRGLTNLRVISAAGTRNSEDVRSRAVQMPTEYIKRQPKTVGDLPIDGEGYVNWTSVDVDVDGKAFIGIEEKLGQSTFVSVKVLRTEHGVAVTSLHQLAL